MNASVKIELSDAQGNRVSVEVVGHENQHSGSVAVEAQKMATDLLQVAAANSAKTPNARQS